MEIGSSSEQKLAHYLYMDLKNEKEVMIAGILEKIRNHEYLSSEEVPELLKYIREINMERYFNHS